MYDDYYFDREEDNVLHDAYLMAVDAGYSDEEMRALREIILAETRFDLNALNHNE